MNQIRVPMPLSRRAKQFMAFDALKGFKEAIAATERYTEPKKELTDYGIELLNAKLTALRKGQAVKVIYYGEYEEKYLQLTGSVQKVDPFWGFLQIGDVVIDFPEIYEITLLNEDSCIA